VVAGRRRDGGSARAGALGRVAVLLLAASVLAVACGDDDDDEGAAATASTETTAATDQAGTAADADAGSDGTAVATTSGDDVDTAAFPVTIEHRYGSTEITEEPERVVSVGFADQDPILALGVVPVGIRDWYGDQPFAVWPWAQDELGDGEPEVLSTELNFEAIAALQPDLIVGISSGMTESEYETLSAIAPTIAQSDEYIEYGEPWQAATLTIGEALGRADEARALVDETEALFTEAREDHPEFAGATAVVGYYYGNGTVGGYGPQDSRSRMLVDLGFEIPAAIVEQAGDQFYADFSAEEMGLLDADVLVWIVADFTTGEAIRADPIRQQLRAFVEGREVFLDTVELGGAASFSSVLSFPYLFETFIPQLAAAVDGDPATEVP
jgi:iron complex transport system substrate-binding protein